MDTISNFIIKLKNASNASHEEVSVPYSNLKLSIAEVLKKEGFIRGVEKKSDRVIIMEKPKVKGVNRISKPSKRVYQKAGEIRGVKSGYGALIISTSKGVMTGREAKKMKLGGEPLFSIW